MPLELDNVFYSLPFISEENLRNTHVQYTPWDVLYLIRIDLIILKFQNWEINIYTSRIILDVIQRHSVFTALKKYIMYDFNMNIEHH